MRARLVGAPLRNGLAMIGLWYSLMQLVASEERAVPRKRAAGPHPACRPCEHRLTCFSVYMRMLSIHHGEKLIWFFVGGNGIADR